MGLKQGKGKTTGKPDAAPGELGASGGQSLLPSGQRPDSASPWGWAWVSFREYGFTAGLSGFQAAANNVAGEFRPIERAVIAFSVRPPESCVQVPPRSLL